MQKDELAFLWLLASIPSIGVHVATVGKEFLLHKLFQASDIPATALSLSWSI